MTEHVKIDSKVRTCQQNGGSLSILIPSEFVEKLELKPGLDVDVSIYVKYKKDENGNLLTNAKGEPIILKKWGTFWKAK
jgi:hypothetical protein